VPGAQRRAGPSRVRPAPLPRPPAAGALPPRQPWADLTAQPRRSVAGEGASAVKCVAAQGSAGAAARCAHAAARASVGLGGRRLAKKAEEGRGGEERRRGREGAGHAPTCRPHRLRGRTEGESRGHAVKGSNATGSGAAAAPTSPVGPWSGEVGGSCAEGAAAAAAAAAPGRAGSSQMARREPAPRARAQDAGRGRGVQGLSRSRSRGASSPCGGAVARWRRE
jgi:hypothetical protein